MFCIRLFMVFIWRIWCYIPCNMYCIYKNDLNRYENLWSFVVCFAVLNMRISAGKLSTTRQRWLNFNVLSEMNGIKICRYYIYVAYYVGSLILVPSFMLIITKQNTKGKSIIFDRLIHGWWWCCIESWVMFCFFFF